MQHRSTQPSRWLSALLLVLLFSVLAAPAALARYSAGSSPIHQAWARVQELGAYRYDARVDLTMRPQPRLENVGLSSKHQQLAIDGQVDLRAQTMDMRMLTGAGGYVSGNGVLELHTANGVTRSRVAGGEWQTDQAPTSAFAPGGDFMVYLSAARNISQGQSELRAGLELTHYSFDVDSLAFANLMHDRMEQELRRSGRLPAGAQLDLSNTYLGMTGTGEVWLNADGLPLRQIITISIPDDAQGQTTDAILTTDFSGFPPPTPLSQSGRWLAQIDWQTGVTNVTLLAAALAMAIVLMRAARSRPVYVALAAFTIVAMLTTPLLQAGLMPAAVAAAERPAAAPAQIAPVAATSAMGAVQAAVPRRAFDAHTSALALAATAPLAAPNSADADKDGLSDEQELQIGTTSTITDTDQDGLSDGVEVLELGTRPLSSDTDGDGLPDGLEVDGITGPDGRTWYLDPFAVDSNHDGQSDLFECASATYCPDTDGDNIPNPFDDDNDGDGIPDRLDDAPDDAIAGGRAADGQLLSVPNQTFDFQFQGFTPGKLLAVDFTVRPTNPAHLWYNGNVLDWPSDDRAGQVQRVHDTTFGDSGSLANGDMRLMPMMEIEIPFDSNNSFGGLPVKTGVTAMPPIPSWTGVVTQDQQLQEAWFNSWLDRQTLRDYQIAVRLKDDRRTLVAYVPLDMLRDPVSDTPVAFTARMLYRPLAAAFGPQQKMRLAWTVAALQDRCSDPPTDASAAETFNNQQWLALPAAQRQGNYTAWADKTPAQRIETWCADQSNWQTHNGPIQTYYDDFYIGALSVVEDRGVQIAAALQLPNADGSPFQQHLWNLARNLDRAFVGGRDCPTSDAGGQCVGDGQRDITVAEIKRRFDGSRAGVSAAEQWGIPANTLKVATYSFDSEVDQARLLARHLDGDQEQNAKLLDLLNQTYVSGGSASVANPTVLIAREWRLRAASIGDSAQVALDGSAATIDITTAPELVQAAVKWQPFTYKGASVWEATDLQKYTDGLDSIYSPLLSQGGSDAEHVAGGVKMLKNFYLALVDGRTRVVEQGGHPTRPANPAIIDANLPLPAAPADALSATVADLAQLLIPAQQHRALFVHADADQLIGAIGRQQLYQDGGAALSLLQGLGNLAGTDDSAQLLGKALQGVSVTAMQSGFNVSVAATAISLGGDVGASIEAVVGVVQDTLEVREFYKGVKSVVDAAEAARTSWSAAKGVFGSAKAALKAAGAAAIVIAIVVELVIGIVKLVALWAQGWNGWAVAKIVAETASSIVVAVFMTVLAAFIPIGTIIAVAISLIDLIAWGICKLGGWEDADSWAYHLCDGIAGNLVKALMVVFWDDNPIVDMQAADRLDFQNWQIIARDPQTGAQTGYVHNNILDLQVDTVTRLPENSYTVIRAAGGVFDADWGLDNALTDSTFRYQFTTTEEQNDQRIDRRLQLEPEQMISAWKKDASGVYSTTQHITGTVPLDHPAINWKPASLFLAEGHAIDSIYCVTVICGRHDQKDANYLNLTDNFVFDVFPNTLDSFYTLSDRGQGGFALGWDNKFPVLADADGDGLRSKAKGGNDPSDNSPDTDGDGLGDFYELQHAGQGFDPLKKDTDGDGLSDLDEARLHTNPALADMDNDGLSDKAELDGWQIVYGYDASNQPLRFRTSSDPFKADTDDDGLLDKQEQTYGFNPRVYNSNTVLTILSQLDENDGSADGIVADNTTIGYSATITNTLRDRYALGLFETELPGAATSSDLLPRSYLLGPHETTSLSGSLHLADLSTSQKTALTNRAGAIIADQRALAGGRSVWLHLDEPAGASSFSDSSTLGNRAVCDDLAACPLAGLASYSGRGIKIQTVGGKKSLLRVDNTPALAADRFTISLWIKPKDVSPAANIVAKQLAPNTQTSYALALDHLAPALTVQDQSCSVSTQVQAPPLEADKWALLTASYDGSYLRLYVNGVINGSERLYSAGICANSAAIRIGDTANGAELDELSIYPFALTGAEVLAQFRDPILNLNFDGTLADSSQLHQTTTPKGRDSIGLPNRDTGKAAQFDKKRWIQVGPSADLDLSKGSGNFTLAAWMRPVPLQYDIGNWIGVLGREDGNSSYPSIQAKFSSTSGNGVLRAVFGNGAARCESAQTGAWLKPGQWQHVALSFTGTQFIFYQDGVQKDVLALPSGCAGNPRPAPGNQLDIGRTSPDGWLDVVKIEVSNEGDGAGDAEYAAYWDGANYWSRDGIDAGDGNDGCGNGCYSDVGADRTMNDDNAHNYKLIEDDDGTNNIASNDDEQVNASLRSNDVTTGNSDATKQWSYSSDGAGTITYRIWNNFFNGDLDDVRVYRYALSQQDADALYRADSRSAALQLRFEEPPTSELFRDGSGNLTHGLCAGNDCPTSGLGGRDGQALRFNGGQAVLVPDRPALDLPNSFTVAAWVKLDNPNANQKIVSKFDLAAGGFILGVQNGQIYGEMKDPQGNLYAVQGGSISAGVWTHLAITATAGGYLIGYVNGQEVGRTAFLDTGRVTAAEGLPRASGTFATLWGDGNFSNNDDDMKLVISGDNPDLDFADQNEASSVAIGDACVELYADNDYEGSSYVVCDNTGSLGGLNDDTDSVRYYKQPPSTSGGALALDAAKRQSVALDPAGVGEPQFSSITIAARVDLSSTGGTYTIASRGNNDSDYDDGRMDSGFRFDLVNGKLHFSAGGGAWSSNNAIDANEHHVAVTLGDGKLRFYIDGVLDSENNFGGNINDVSANDILLGRGPDCGGRPWCEFFNGKMRAVAMYSRVLSAADIQSLKDDKPQDVGAVGRAFYLPLDEVNGATSFSMLVAQPLGVNDTPLTVGRASWGNTFGVSGLIDELSVQQIALPQSGIQALIDQAPVLNLHLDEAIGATAFENTADGNPDGASAGANLPKAGAAGRIRDALVFDGSDDRIWLADTPAFDLNNFTIELWARPGAIKTAAQPLVAKAADTGAAPNYLLELAPNSLNLRLKVDTNTLTSQKPLNQAQWNHIVATYDGAALRLFVNGTLDSSLALSGTPLTNSALLNIGGLASYGAHFDGMLDELAIYRYALDADAIKAHYDYQESWFDIAVRHDLTIDADNPTVAVSQPENTIIPNRETILAIVAADLTAPIVKVEYNTGSGWQAATRDNDVWVFSYTPAAASGTATINVRAFDSVGHTSQSTRTLIVDGIAPTLTIDPALAAGNLRPAANAADNTWTLNLSGTAADAVSKPVRVTATLHDQNGVVGNPIILTGIDGAWSGLYRFPYPPNGRYELTVQAEDAIGNQSALQSAIVALDAIAPMADVTVGQTRLGGAATAGVTPLRRMLAQSVTAPPVSQLRGTVGDTLAPARAIVRAHFEEPAGASEFLDSSLEQRRGLCAASSCPSAGVAGWAGSALTFDGADDTVAFSDLTPAGSQGAQRFTLMAWIKPAGVAGQQTAVSATQGASDALELQIAGTQLTALLALDGTLQPVGQGVLTVGAWNQVVMSYDGDGVSLYVDGARISTQAVSGHFAGFDTLWAGSHNGASSFYQGGIDELAIYGTVLPADQVRSLNATVNSNVSAVELRLVHARDFDAPSDSWVTAAISQTNAGFTNWSYPVPLGIEGPYRVDLRTTDTKGNQHVIPNVWSGDIDTLAPRVGLLARTLPDGSTRIYCLATDYNLDDASLDCPAPAETWQRGYQSAAWYQQLYGATQKLETMRASTVITGSDALSITACDSFGYCSTAAGDTNAPLEPGISLILTPAGTQLVDSFDPIAIEGYAYAGVGLQSLVVSAGGTTLDSRTLAGEQQLSWNTSFTPTAEGIYPIQARAQASGGAVYTDTLAPVIVVDLAAPLLSLGTAALTSTTVLSERLATISGLVTETHGLQSLEVQVDGAAWQALAVPAAGTATAFSGQIDLGRSGPFDGEQTTLTLRARDLAGRATIITRTLALDTAAPQASITSVAPSVTTAEITGSTQDAAGVRMLEVGLRPSGNPAAPIDWRPATLAQPDAMATTWRLLLPAAVERSFVLSLRTTDIFGNQRSLIGVWSGDLIKLAPQFTSAAPADGTYSVAYQHDFTASGDGTIGFSATGALPPGLNLNPATGVLQGTPTLAGSYTFSVTANSEWKPDATQVVTITIARVPLTLTIADKSKIYGQPNPVFTYTLNLSQLVNGDDAGVVSGAPATSADASSPVGTYPIVAGTLATANYALNVIPATLTVDPARLTVTADSQTRRINTPNPALTISYGGFVNGDDASDLSVVPTTATTATLNTLPGVYPIDVSGGAADNYRIEYITGTLTIVERDVPAISWAPAAITYGTPLGTSQLSAAASVNGQPLAGTLIYSPPLGTLLQAGNGQILHVAFTPADSVNFVPVEKTVSIDVAQAQLTATAANQTRRVNTPNPALTFSYGGFVNGEDAGDLSVVPTATTTATLASLPGAYPIVVSGGVASNYRIEYLTGTLTIRARDVPLIDWRAPATISYGQRLSATQLNAAASFGGRPVAGTLSYNPPLGTLLHAGRAQTLRVSFTPADSVNFAPVEQTVTLDVNQARLTATADSLSIFVGEQLPALTYRLAGFVNGDDMGDLDAPVQITTMADGSRVGIYPITLGGAVDADYDIVYVDGTLSVFQRWFVPLVRQ